MARNGSENKPAKRAKIDIPSTTPAGTSNEAYVTSQSSASMISKGKKPASYFDFFQDLPADILGEIVSYLAPVDLLHLARTTKELRCTLMSSSSSVFWKRARQNVPGLPPRPDELSEPAYAHYLFSEFCHKCLAADQDVLLHLEARTQLCESCTLEEFKKWKELPEEVDTALSEFVPDTTNQLTAKEKKDDLSRASVEYRTMARTRFHVKTAMKLHREYKKLRGAKKTLWLEDQKKAWKAIETHAVECRKFLNSQMWKALATAGAARRRRMEQIGKRLAELGYGDEFRQRDKYPALINTPGRKQVSVVIVVEIPKQVEDIVFQEHPLTDAEWDEMRDYLIQWMEEVREHVQRQERMQKMRRRVESSLGQVYTTFALSQPARSLIPTLAELASMDAFAEPLNSVALDADMPDGSLDPIVARIPQMVAEWQAQLDECLLSLLRRSSAYDGRQDLTRDILSYASTLFTCTRCAEALRYPDIFVHLCFSTRLAEVDSRLVAPVTRTRAKQPTTTSRKASKLSQDSQDDVSFVQAALGQAQDNHYRFWCPGALLRFDEAMHYHTVSLLNQLHMDRTTTSATLLSLNPFVEGTCQCFSAGCSAHATASKTVVRWSQILSRCRRHRSQNYMNSLSPVNDAELQGLLSTTAGPSYSTRYRCFWCGASAYNGFALTWHLSGVHSLSQADAVRAWQIAPRTSQYPDATFEIRATKVFQVSGKHRRIIRG